MTQTEYAKLAGLSKPRVCQLVKAGMPLDSKEGADAWRGMGAQKRATERHVTPLAGLSRPPEVKGPVDPTLAIEDSPRGAYERQKQIERAAYDLAARSLQELRPDAGRLVSIHGQAVQNLCRTREEVLKLAEKERSLVSGDWVRKVMVDHDGVVAALIRSMPKQLAVRICRRWGLGGTKPSTVMRSSICDY